MTDASRSQPRRPRPRRGRGSCRPSSGSQGSCRLLRGWFAAGHGSPSQGRPCRPWCSPVRPVPASASGAEAAGVGAAGGGGGGGGGGGWGGGGGGTTMGGNHSGTNTGIQKIG